MRARILLAALLLVITATAAHSQDCPQITRYTISTADNGTAHFKIELTLMGEMMSIITKASEEGKRTEDFVLNPTITGSHGTSEMASLGNGDWDIAPAKIGDRVTVEYDLLLEHGNYTWDMGKEEIGFALGDGAFLIGRMTVMADYTARSCPVEVKFEAKDSAAP